jgi:hypothetical protein
VSIEPKVSRPGLRNNGPNKDVARTLNFFADCVHFGVRAYLFTLLGNSPTIQRSGANYASGKGAAYNS